jgi:hypothetical protein
MMARPLPKYPCCIGKIRRIVAIDGRPREFRIEDEIVHRQNSARSPKLIFLQKVRFSPPDERVEYRFTYYMLSKKAGWRWVFGQCSAAKGESSRLDRRLGKRARSES